MLLNIHTMECYLVIRNKQTSDICNNTDESKTIKLMKTNHKQKRIYSMIPFVWESRKDNIYSNRELISDCPGPGRRNWLQRSTLRAVPAASSDEMSLHSCLAAKRLLVRATYHNILAWCQWSSGQAEPLPSASINNVVREGYLALNLLPCPCVNRDLNLCPQIIVTK